jgi:hypothetical protein
VLKIVTFFGRWLASRCREAVKPARWMGSLFALIVAVSESQPPPSMCLNGLSGGKAVARTGFAEDSPDVVLDRQFGNDQPGCNFLVRDTSEMSGSSCRSRRVDRQLPRRLSFEAEEWAATELNSSRQRRGEQNVSPRTAGADCSKKIRSRTLTRNVADRSRGSNGKTSPGLLAPPKKQPESPELPCALLKQELRGRKLSDSRTHHSLVDQEERARFIEFCGNAVERKVTIV